MEIKIPSGAGTTQQEITSSVLFGDVMVRNGIFWTIGEQSYIVYDPIISYQKIKVYRV